MSDFCIVSVEDDPGIFALIQLTLNPLPTQLYHADTGKSAIELINQLPVDLIILDITLPDVNGWQVLERIKVDKQKLKGIIVLTGRTEAPNRIIAHLHDVTAYVNKPFKPSFFRNKVKEVLGIA